MCDSDPGEDVEAAKVDGALRTSARIASARAFNCSAVTSVEKRKLKSMTTVPGITLLAPVPPWILLIGDC